MFAPMTAAQSGPMSIAIVRPALTLRGNESVSSADARIIGLRLDAAIMTSGIRTADTMTSAAVNFSTGLPRPLAHSLNSRLTISTTRRLHRHAAIRGEAQEVMFERLA